MCIPLLTLLRHLCILGSLEVWQRDSNNIRVLEEKQLKRWSRTKKEWLINQKNPDWKSINIDLLMMINLSIVGIAKYD